MLLSRFDEESGGNRIGLRCRIAHYYPSAASTAQELFDRLPQTYLPGKWQKKRWKYYSSGLLEKRDGDEVETSESVGGLTAPVNYRDYFPPDLHINRSLPDPFATGSLLDVLLWL